MAHDGAVDVRGFALDVPRFGPHLTACEKCFVWGNSDLSFKLDPKHTMFDVTRAARSWRRIKAMSGSRVSSEGERKIIPDYIIVSER